MKLLWQTSFPTYLVSSNNNFNQVKTTAPVKINFCEFLGTINFSLLFFDFRQQFFPTNTEAITFTGLTLNKVDLDDVDGSGEPSALLDFDQIPLTATSTEIRQREPQMQLTIKTKEPALIGEWFHIKVQLVNNELSNVKNVTLVASLEEANDPIIADTTRLTLDYK